MKTTKTKQEQIATADVMDGELRAEQNKDGTTELQGYACVFNQVSTGLARKEYIMPHALDDVDFSKTMLVYAHDLNKPLARVDSGTLQISIDKHGLKFTAELPNTTLANDIRQDILAGNIKGCSFRFTVDPAGDEYVRNAAGETVRYIHKIATVRELTLTAIPAYNETSVEVTRDEDNNKEDSNNMTDNNDNKKVKTDVVAEEKRDSSSDNDDLASIKEELRDLSEKYNKLVSHHDEKRDDDDPDDASDADSDADEETDTEHQNSSASSSVASSAAASSTASSAANSSVASSAVSSSTDNTTSVASTVNNLKEEKRDMTIDITPNNANNAQQLNDFKNFMLTGHIANEEMRDGTASNVGLPTGSVVIPETILTATHEVHQYPRLKQYANNVSVSTPTGKQPYFTEETEGLYDKAEFDHAKAAGLSSIKTFNWSVGAHAAQIPISRELIMSTAKVGTAPAWVAEAQNQISTRVDNFWDSVQAKALMTNPGNTVTATDAISDIKHALNANLQPVDRANSQILLTNSAFDKLDQIKDGMGRPMLQPDPTNSTPGRLFGKDLVILPDELLGTKAGDMVAVVAPLKKVLYNFQLGQVSGQFDDTYDVFMVYLGIMLLSDTVNARPDLVSVIKLTDKSIAKSDQTTVSTGK